MSSPISLLYIRAYVHATEDPKKVLAALNNIVRGPYVTKTVRGHYGNQIQIIELNLSEFEALDALKSILAKLDDVEFTLLLSGIEESKLYAKFDKQKAVQGVLKISQGDDVIYLEARCKTFVVNDFKNFLISIREALKT
ncbi:MAG: RNA-binding domain-containing protein [Pyrobaculum sp.]